MTTHVAARQSFSLTKRPRDALTGPLFGFAIAGAPAIRGIAQHAPNGGSLPAAFAGSCRNLTLIQQTCHGIDAEALLAIDLKTPSAPPWPQPQPPRRMLLRCHSSSHTGSRKEHRKAHSPHLVAPCVFCLAGTAQQSGRVRIRRSCPETAPGADPPG